ncbi:MAG: sterol carrier protein [Halorientalis sp.]
MSARQDGTPTDELTYYELDAYFPTTAWLETYADRLSASEALDREMDGWGVDWNGAFVFEIRNLPIFETAVDDLPEELWRNLGDAIRQLPDSTLEAVMETAPEEIQRNVEARTGSLQERAAAELLETPVAESPEKVWPGLRNIMPDVLDALVDELDEHVTDEGHVFAWLDVVDGDCRETATMQTLDEREHRVRLTGEYADWKRLLSSDLDLLDAVMGGTLNVTADMKNVLQYMDAQQVMVEIAAETDKRYLF